MIKRKQIYFHNPEKGSHGDCYRTCIACILEIEPVEVPNFGVHYENNEKFFAEADKYLASQFLARVNHAFDCTLEDLLKMQNHCNPDAYWILTGRSKNETNHCVVCLGGEIVWDPAMDDSGITGPSHCEDGSKLFWAEYLVPSIATRKGIQ